MVQQSRLILDYTKQVLLPEAGFFYGALFRGSGGPPALHNSWLDISPTQAGV